jgi:hypothetical protein
MYIYMSKYIFVKINGTVYPISGLLMVSVVLNAEIRVGGCIQKFSDWPSGARTANSTAIYH